MDGAEVVRAAGDGTEVARAALRRIRLVVEYDGTDFHGFQHQPAHRTVAGVLERTLSRLFEQEIKVTAAGRTDAGVHAIGQVVSFSATGRFPVDRLVIAANSVLPPDLTVREAAVVDHGFSARFDALERRYVYLVLNRREPSALLRRYAHHEHRALDLDALRAAAADLCGRHDFAAFCGVAPESGSTVRTVHAVDVEAAGGQIVRLRFRGDGFLHRMVRIAVGTLLEIAAGRRDPRSIPAIIAGRDRRNAGLTAPPQGLYLVGVRYRDFDSQREPMPLGLPLGDPPLGVAAEAG